MNLKMKEAYDIIYIKNKARIEFYGILILSLEKEERKATEAKLRGEKSNYNAVKKLLNKNKTNFNI